jgi:hypothetical protein
MVRLGLALLASNPSKGCLWKANRQGLRRFEVGSHVVPCVSDAGSVLMVRAPNEQLLPTISDRNDSCSKRKGDAGMASPLSFRSIASYFVIGIRISPPVISFGNPRSRIFSNVGEISRSDPSCRSR